jgi:hypothetical protein
MTHEGSMQGSVIQINAQGITPSMLDDIRVRRTSNNWEDCLTTTIPSYGVIICEVENTRDFDTKQLGVKYDDVTHTCTDIVADSTDCDYH